MKTLVADDEKVSCRLLQASLEKWGHEVVVAEDGNQAWELFQRHRCPLVLTDWVMPGMDGLELIRRIRALPGTHYVFIILLTARAEKTDVVQGMEAGADDFIVKPFDREELRVRLRAGERVLHLEQTLAEQNRVLREAQAALVQNEKLASLGQLSAGIAHEINNPLSYVTNNFAVLRRDVTSVMEILDRYRAGRELLAQGNPELLAEVDELEQDLDLEYVQENLPRLFSMSEEGMRRVGEIVRNLRDFARLDRTDLQEMDLNNCVESTVEILRYELKKYEIDLKLHLGELPLLTGYPGKINQVLLNVLANAVQACTAGGVITIRTSCRTRSVTGNPSSSGQELTVEIEDNGCGIRPDHLPHIFEPFFTTKPVGEGTGLGLSVSYGIVRDHGGTIEVDSEPGRGSLFRIQLPRRQQEEWTRTQPIAQALSLQHQA